MLKYILTNIKPYTVYTYANTDASTHILGTYLEEHLEMWIKQFMQKWWKCG